MDPNNNEDDTFERLNEALHPDMRGRPPQTLLRRRLSTLILVCDTLGVEV
jgi:hypothetical protein